MEVQEFQLLELMYHADGHYDNVDLPLHVFVQYLVWPSLKWDHTSK